MTRTRWIFASILIGVILGVSIGVSQVPLSDLWRTAFQDCDGAPCLNVTNAAADGPWLGAGTVDDLFREAFQDCSGTPCLTITGVVGGEGGISDGDKGDVVVSSSGTVWTIDNDVVSYAKIQNVSATDRVLCRDTAGAGNIEECTVTAPLQFTGGPGLSIAAASDSAAGVVELATAAETTTGTDTGRAVTPDGLAGSVFGQRTITIECIPDATAVTTGDGKCYFPIPTIFNGWVVVEVSAHVGAVVSSSGAVNVDIDVCGAVATGIRCSGSNRDLLSTNITIDANEDGTETAATPAVINTSNDDLATGEWLRYNVDGAGTDTQGLWVTVILQKP